MLFELVSCRWGIIEEGQIQPVSLLGVRCNRRALIRFPTNRALFI